jgi:MFS superfamily sulfate permease-like transporter
LPFDEPLTFALVIVGVIVACFIIVYAIAKKGGREEKPSEVRGEAELKSLPFKIVKTISAEEAKTAKEELRILDLEREILSDAIRRLYEAHAEGKITEEERETLAQTYKARMMAVKEAISKDESIVALHELEAMQEDLIKLFSERFDEISAKVEELRSKVEAKPIKEIAVPAAKPTAVKVEEEKEAAEEKAAKKKRKPPAKPTPITEAEKRIEEIRAEVEKVLERLGQMEIET